MAIHWPKPGKTADTPNPNTACNCKAFAFVFDYNLANERLEPPSVLKLVAKKENSGDLTFQLVVEVDDIKRTITTTVTGVSPVGDRCVSSI